MALTEIFAAWRPVAVVVAVAVALIAPLSCGGMSEPRQITEKRTVPERAAPVTSEEPDATERLAVPPSDAPDVPADLPEGHPDISSLDLASTDKPPAPDTGYSWDTPEGWKQQSPRPMRVVSFATGPGKKCECYVTELLGDGGGIQANINRWREQMSQPPLAAEAIDDLERIEMMGKQSPMVEIAGTYTSMTGGTQSEALMLGVICESAGRSLFVKMTGPEKDVTDQKERFIAFCKSFK